MLGWTNAVVQVFFFENIIIIDSDDALDNSIDLGE